MRQLRNHLITIKSNHVDSLVCNLEVDDFIKDQQYDLNPIRYIQFRFIRLNQQKAIINQLSFQR